MPTPQERWECPNCGTPLNIAALGIYAKVACPVCNHIDHVHTMLANFRIEGVLGLGGMSVVLRARDLVLERPVAIKLLNEFYRDQPERIARFEQECELMAKVRHENVVSVYSAGHIKGQFYIAMELISGHNLEELVREQGPMDPLHALDVLQQVVQGLAAAYKAGLLHRDMKPGNILICEDGRAKVLDFGLSLGKRDTDTEDIIWATPFYVPPETLQREAEDTRTDIYALGMTLRHLLTGQENFVPAPEGIEQMLACKQALLPMAEVMPELPEAYCDLVDHMTAYAPEHRPENYAALQVEIAEVRAALMAENKGMSPRDRLKLALPLLAGATVTLVLGGGAFVLAKQLATPEPEPLFLTVPQHYDWQECDTLSEALLSLQRGELQNALHQYQRLAESQAEPAACAWAALHVRVLSLLLGEMTPDTFDSHLTRPPAPAGRPLVGQMSALQQPDAAPAVPFLQAVVALRRAEEAGSRCQEAEMKQQLQVTRGALRAAGPSYAPLLPLLDRHEAALVANQPTRAATRYRHALMRLDMEEAARAFSLMTAAPADTAARPHLAVQQEALTLYTEAAKMMRRHALVPDGGVHLATPEQLQEQLVPLQNPTLAAELATLMLVALGDFAEAAAFNPYAKLPDSTELFAIMMRDWLSRAGACTTPPPAAADEE